MAEKMESVIEAKGLAKTYRTGFFRKKTEALRGIDLEVKRNEILGFLGPNGAGKTTAIKILLGIVYPSDGTAKILGRPLGDVKVKNSIGFMPEQPYFYDYLKGREFLDFYGRFHGLEKQKRAEKVEALLEKVGLAHAADMALRKYSKGMLQRIGMAQALLGDPELVILDEPMSGLDPLGRRDIREIVLGLKEEGKTVFFSSHILPDVEQICDRVVILNKGEVRGEGPLSEILRPGIEHIDMQFDGLDEDAFAALRSEADKEEEVRVIRKADVVLITVSGWETAEKMETLGKEKGGKMISFQARKQDLESYFLEETGAEGAS